MYSAESFEIYFNRNEILSTVAENKYSVQMLQNIFNQPTLNELKV